MIQFRSGERVLGVEVKRSGEELQVTVGDESFAFRLEEISAGTFLLREGDRVETFYCVREGPQVHVFFRGTAYRIIEEGENEGRGHSRALSDTLEAPMPGKVIQVNVTPGQAVVKGEEVLVVEAMKMENAVRAPRDGIVRAVRVKVGDLVSPGTVLVELS
ncbi:MAG TPA: biotin/lipoyl-containing protein [Vicinamibacteria bacterium]|nr:biotin/lipoyl-containing protein [Vicinamibacteria bacterium]